MSITKNEGRIKNELCPDGENILPAGVMYYRADVPEISLAVPAEGALIDSLAANSLGKSGLFLDDLKLLDAQDKTGSGMYIPIAFGENSKPDAKSRKILKTIGEFEEIEKQVEQTVAEIASAVKSGDAAASPREPYGENATCRYCPMLPLCRFSPGKEDASDE